MRERKERGKNEGRDGGSKTNEKAQIKGRLKKKLQENCLGWNKEMLGVGKVYFETNLVTFEVKE